MILFTKIDIKTPAFKRRIIKEWLKRTASKFEKVIGDVSFIFCSDDKIIEINKMYLSHDYYTDIITFDYSKNKIISGDIFISIETVKSNADLYCITFNQELYRVMIHGILHLCGLQDKTKKEKTIMRHHENLALENLKSLMI